MLAGYIMLLGKGRRDSLKDQIQDLSNTELTPSTGAKPNALIFFETACMNDTQRLNTNVFKSKMLTIYILFKLQYQYSIKI